MKKIALIAIAMMAFATMANAQLYVGGSLGINNNSSKKFEKMTSPISKDTTEFGSSSTTFSIAPEIGFFLSDNFAVGAYLGLGFSSENNRAAHPTKVKGFEWSINPYARWYAIKSDKFGVFLEGGVSFAQQSSKVIAKTATETTTVKRPSYNTFAITITPGLSYALNEHIELQTRLNVLGAHFMRTAQVTKVDEEVLGVKMAGTEKDIAYSSGLNFNSRDALRLATVSVGFIYKF